MCHVSNAEPAFIGQRKKNSNAIFGKEPQSTQQKNRLFRTGYANAVKHKKPPTEKKQRGSEGIRSRKKRGKTKWLLIF